MNDILKLANYYKININIQTLDGSYRPLVGHVVNIITLTSALNPEITKQIVITKTDTETYIECEIDKAIRAIKYVHENQDICHTEAEMLREREAFFYNK